LNYITIVTPDNIEIEYRLAGLGSRLAAVFVDFMLQAAVATAIIFAVLFGVIGFGAPSYSINEDNLQVGIGLIILTIFVIYMGYGIVCEMLMHGQTLGKRLLKLRVIRDNGMPISLIHSIVRNIFKLTLDMLGAGVFFIFFNKRYKRIGDLAASTIVIAESKNLSITAMPILVEGVNLLENLQLNDDEYYMLVEFFSRRNSFLDSGEKLKGRITAYFSKKFDSPEQLLAEDVLFRLAQMNRR
jgi:uncharacterized RDD family membrane protein YckC